MRAPSGAGPKREREAKKLERKFKKEKRYAGREHDVVARIVNKQLRAAGETKQKQKPPHCTTSRRKSRSSHSRTRCGTSKRT